MKQTAVEWFESKLYEFETIQYSLPSGLYEYINQAKEMEKQQIIDAGNSCAIKQHLHNEKVNKMSMDEMLEFANTQTVTFGEQYYNEKFNLSQQDKP